MGAGVGVCFTGTNEMLVVEKISCDPGAVPPCLAEGEFHCRLKPGGSVCSDGHREALWVKKEHLRGSSRQV